MLKHDKLVADVIAAAGGEVVGRIRLQKILYLLDSLGMNADAEFQYYHYGPYSRRLDDALDRAKAFLNVTEKTRFRSDGVAYSVFSSKASAPNKIGDLDLATARGLITLMKSATSTVIEVAATIHWLRHREEQGDWRDELIRRKGAKTEGGRIDKALALLSDLKLSPA